MHRDVIVLGLGAMGSSACYHLAQRGVRVVGIEQFDRGHALGSSHGQSRIIRKAYFEHADYVPLLNRSYELWEKLSAESRRHLYHETGIVYFGAPQSRLIHGLFDSARIHSIPLETLVADELQKIGKWFRVPPEFITVREPKAGFLEVENCILAHLEMAEKSGAKIYTNEKVLQWKSTAAGVEVTTDKNTYHAGQLVVSAGAWSRKILDDLRLPLRILRKSMFWFSAGETHSESNGMPCFLYELPSGVFYGFPKSAADPRGLKVAEHSGGEELPTPDRLNRDLDSKDLTRINSLISDHLVGVEGNAISHQVCMYTMTPDENFIIDKHPDHTNVFFAAGFSGHGFKFSSVVGEILADFATKGATRHPIQFLRLRWK